jgi:tripartite-type tricarboxylate transporter receptor subunit TctC
MNTFKLSRRALAAVALAGMFLGAAQAQTGRVLTIVVPQPAGNPTDGIARKIQPLLQKLLDQTVVVENQPGAGGSIGLHKVLGAPADGQILVITSQTEPILTPLAMANVRYKPEDLRAVALVGRTAYVLAGRPDLPATTLAELTALARQSGAKPLSHGHIGEGSMIQLLGEQWGRKAGVQLTQVPYKGVPPLIQDLMGGQIDLGFQPLGGSTVALADSGKLRVYGTTAAVAWSRLPKVAPLSQQDKSLGGFVYGTWAALLMPRATPEATVQRLHQAIATALKDPDVQAYVQTSGIEMSEPMSLPQLDRFYQAETLLYQGLARELGVKPQ